MEPEKLEEYKEATGIALLNAYSNGLLSREEYQLIQKFKRGKWKDVEDFLRSTSEEKGVSEKEKEDTNNVYSTDVEYTKNVESEHTKNVESTNFVESTNNATSVIQNEHTKNVESTINEASIFVESLPPRANFSTGTYNETNILIPVLSNVNIKSNFTKFDNDVSDRLNSQQTPLEQSIYNRLYRLSVGWGRNYCRVSTETLMKSCNIKDRRTLNSGIDGLIEKGHIQIINRNNKGILYKILFPHEVLGNENPSNIEIVSITDKPENNKKEYTNNVGSLKKLDKEYTKNVDSTKNPPFKDPKDIFKNTLSPREIYTLFYKGIGQEKITKQKKERAEVNIKKLLEEGFTLEDIHFAVKWTLENAKEEPYDFSIINHTIGQAMAAKEQEKVKEAKRLETEQSKIRKMKEEKKANENREEIKTYKDKLSIDQRSELRAKALDEVRQTKGIREEFITDILIEAKENELIAKELGIDLSETDQ